MGGDGGECADRGTGGHEGYGDGLSMGAGYEDKNVEHKGHPGCLGVRGGAGHLSGRGVGGDGGEDDGGRVGAIGMCCSITNANIEMRRNFEPGSRTRQPGSRTSSVLRRTGSTPPWGRTRSSTPSRRSLTRGGGWGTSSSQNLSNAAFILGANQEKDHHLQRIEAQEQTILVEKAILGQWDGNRCDIGAISVTYQCERAANTSGSQSEDGES